MALGISSISRVANYGPPDDFQNQPTQYGGQGWSGEHPPSGQSPYGQHPYEPPSYEPPSYDRPPLPETVVRSTGPNPSDPYAPQDPSGQGKPPKPWYRKPVLLVLWALLVLALIGAMVFGLGKLLGVDEENNTPSPSPTTTTTTTTAPTTTSGTTTTTTPPTTTGTTESTTAPPPTSTSVQPAPTQQPTNGPTRTPHHPHLPHLPSF
jgi:hypothetical protein